MDPDYDYRHISTVASVDRIIDPLGRRMVNVHDVAVPVERLYEALFEGIDPCHPDRQSFAAQLAVNIRDFVDTDSDSTVLTVADANYHGFEPQPFLRQIGFRISPTAAADQTQNEFMVELHNPFDVPVSTRGLVLRMRVALSGGAWEDRIVVDLDSPPQGPDEEEMPETIPARDSLVLRSRRAVLGQDLGSKRVSRAGVVLALYQGTQAPFQLSQSHHVALCRRAGSALLFLDLQRTQPAWFGWDKVGTGLPQFYARAEGRWNILAPRMTLVAGTSPSPLTRYNLPQQQRIRSGPGLASAGFLTLGDLGRVLSIGPHPDPNSATCLIRAMGQASPPADAEICLDLADPSVAGVFQRLTVLSPEQFGADQAETRVKGRININTAPWFVIARLPWMTDEVAQAIVARRDSSGLGRPYRSVADLMQVPEVADLYGADGRNNYDSNSPGPDLTSDTETDDLEERDLLWSRIGNLVTVRSDVFSAYIVVRIGEDGPQRRVLAVLDRSRVRVPQDRVRVLVLQTVPDPR